MTRWSDASGMSGGAAANTVPPLVADCQSQYDVVNAIDAPLPAGAHVTLAQAPTVVPVVPVTACAKIGGRTVPPSSRRVLVRTWIHGWPTGSGATAGRQSVRLPESDAHGWLKRYGTYPQISATL